MNIDKTKLVFKEGEKVRYRISNYPWIFEALHDVFEGQGYMDVRVISSFNPSFPNGRHIYGSYVSHYKRWAK